MKFICGVLLLVSFAASLPLDSSKLLEKNPCTKDALYGLKYFHTFPSDETKYIKCDQWGSMSVQMCPQGSKWESEMMDCMFLNRTIDTPVLDMDAFRTREQWLMSNMTANKFCTYFGNYSCLNGGICGHQMKCLCFSNTTGEYCEINKPSTGIFSKLINETFSLEEFKKIQIKAMSFMGLNDSFDYNMTLFDRSLMDNLTIEKVSKYFAMFPSGSMRFDTLLNLLVEDFLSLVFPDAFFLREFSIPTEMQMGFSNAIPRLLSVAKYSYDRFESMFAIYEDVLVRLSKFLVEKYPTVKAEAKSFYEIYHLLNEKLDRLYNFTEAMDVKPVGKEIEISREMLVKKLYKDFERVLNNTYELFEMLSELDNQISWRHQIYNISIDEIQLSTNNFTSSPIVLDKINRLLFKTTEIWDVLSFYGFSHVISELTSVPIFESSVVQTTFQALMAEDDNEDDEAETQRNLRSFEEDDEDKIDAREDLFTTRQVREEKLTTVRPQALVGETTTRQVRDERLTTVRPQALVGETTVRPQSLFAEPTTRQIREELTTRQVRDERLTTVKPQALVGETTTRQIRDERLTTVKPQALVGETTTRQIREEKLTTVRPQALVGETTTRQIRDERLTTVRPQALVGESTIRPVREELTTRKLRDERLTTVKPEALVSEEKGTTVKA